jgi:deoxyribonuclease-4
MDRLLFGVSGLPVDAGKKFNYASGIAYLKSIGLDALELQFGRRINVTANNREAILKSKRDNGFTLSAHASYFINLNAASAEKREESVERLRAAAEALAQVQGKTLVLHPGFYGRDSREAAYARVRETLARLPRLGIDYRLETTGKPTQFGTLEELAGLCREVQGCKLCVDFAHIHARGQGNLKGYADFRRILDFVGAALGRAALDDMHIHMSGVAYTDKGERNHLPFAQSDFNYQACLRALKDVGAKGCVISEGPVVERDALLLQKTYAAL